MTKLTKYYFVFYSQNIHRLSRVTICEDIEHHMLSAESGDPTIKSNSAIESNRIVNSNSAVEANLPTESVVSSQQTITAVPSTKSCSQQIASNLPAELMLDVNELKPIPVILAIAKQVEKQSSTDTTVQKDSCSSTTPIMSADHNIQLAPVMPFDHDTSIAAVIDTQISRGTDHNTQIVAPVINHTTEMAPVIDHDTQIAPLYYNTEINSAVSVDAGTSTENDSTTLHKEGKYYSSVVSSVDKYSSTSDSLNRSQFNRFVNTISVKPMEANINKQKSELFDF